MGFGFLFKLDAGSIVRHQGERQPREDSIDLPSHGDDEAPVVAESADGRDWRSLGFGFDATAALQEENDEEAAAIPLPATVRKPTKPGLSAYEKRQQRKQKEKGIEQQLAKSDANVDVSNVDQHSHKPPAKSASSGAGPAKAPVRGKKGKIKKQQERYGDQDADEKAQKMALLGSIPKPKPPSGKDTVVHKARDKPTGSALSARIPALLSASGAESVAEPESPETATKLPELSDTPGSSDRKRTDQAEAAEVRQLLASEDGEAAPTDALESEFDSLTGYPHLDDELLFAIPVCAPYSALKGYKFKVKLQPGTLRKGKAAKLARALLERLPDATDVEKKLIKLADELACAQCLVSNCKVVSAGVTQLQTQIRRDKKK
eukprot:TRINITY_DN9972_c0_g2_i1.p1 TRINITY_DN9972_c0_g2~~TRINITY_DN9972_c0_g2_i1.p1  ORF type:complete len:376 (-),score=39.02 TRINITY_DN9972_c0_g2_i1:110-1237(-)